MVIIHSRAHSEQGKEIKCDIKPRLVERSRSSKMEPLVKIFNWRQPIEIDKIAQRHT
jgi:hypothetical protein